MGTQGREQSLCDDSIPRLCKMRGCRESSGEGTQAATLCAPYMVEAGLEGWLRHIFGQLGQPLETIVHVSSQTLLWCGGLGMPAQNQRAPRGLGAEQGAAKCGVEVVGAYALNPCLVGLVHQGAELHQQAPARSLVVGGRRLLSVREPVLPLFPKMHSRKVGCGGGGGGRGGARGGGGGG